MPFGSFTRRPPLGAPGAQTWTLPLLPRILR